jgi:hypothetical protein
MRSAGLEGLQDGLEYRTRISRIEKAGGRDQLEEGKREPGSPSLEADPVAPKANALEVIPTKLSGSPAIPPEDALVRDLEIQLRHPPAEANQDENEETRGHKARCYAFECVQELTLARGEDVEERHNVENQQPRSQEQHRPVEARGRVGKGRVAFPLSRDITLHDSPHRS